MKNKIKISTSESLKGIRCLKAEEKIFEGEVIEECPVILIPKEQMDKISETILTHYEFIWDTPYDAIALGYGSLYNHSSNPNVTFDLDFDRKVIVFTALEDIETDTELLIDYHGEDSVEIDPAYIDFNL